MQDFVTGAIRENRLGSVVNRQIWKMTSGDGQLTTGVSRKFATLPASAANPVLYKVRVVTVVANTASGAVTGSIGTTSGGTEVINATSLKATAGTVVAGTNDFVYAEADVDLYATYTVASGTDAAGKWLIILEAIALHDLAISSNN